MFSKIIQTMNEKLTTILHFLIKKLIELTKVATASKSQLNKIDRHASDIATIET